MSEKITVTLRTIPQYHARFGMIEWFAGGFFRPDQDWVEDEEKRLAPLIEPIIDPTIGKE